MSISKDVNVDLLNKCFELGPFHGLHVPHPDDVLEPVQSEPDIDPEDDVDDDGEEEEFDEGNDETVSLY